MTKRDKKFFTMARNTAFLSSYDGPHLGAVVVSGNRVLSYGYNTNKTSPLQHKYNKYKFKQLTNTETPDLEHAEVKAIRPLISDPRVNFNQTTLYIYRVKKNGDAGCSRPCPACAKLIHNLGIKTIHYINEDSEFCEEKIL